MLHLHFGAGRLGLGLVAPFFRTPESELHLLNRAVSRSNATGGTALSPARRNELLLGHPERHYFIRRPGAPPDERATVRYERFHTFEGEGVGDLVRSIADASPGLSRGVVVTASILDAASYEPVIRALNELSRRRETDGESVGRIFLVACENTLTAHEVLQDERLLGLIGPEAREHVVPVHALVDRLCVGLEEDDTTPHPTVLVRAEDYGSLKLQLTPETEPLADLVRGSRVEFSRHVDVEKQIKGWLVNGTHWLIALSALRPGQPPSELKLNEYLNASEKNRRFAAAALDEMSEGVAILLKGDPKYADFAREVDVDAYLVGAKKKILERFSATEDPITRILARFRSPTEDEVHSIESFNRRFADRIDAPLEAYAAEHGAVPPAASQSLFNMHRLLASGHFVDAASA
jgi:hypothetical protein